MRCLFCLEILYSLIHNSCYLAGFRKFWWDVYFVWKYFILWYITIVTDLGLQSFDEMFICIWKYFVLWHINFRSNRRKTNKQVVNFCCCCCWNILFFEYNNYYWAETYKQFYLWLGACELSFTNYPEYPSSEIF